MTKSEVKSIYSPMCLRCPQSDIQLITAHDKVGASEATLLNMLKIFPFSYGLVIQQGQWPMTSVVTHTQCRRLIPGPAW